MQFNTDEILWPRPLQEAENAGDVQKAAEVPGASSVRDPGLGHQRHAACLQAGADVGDDAHDEEQDRGPDDGRHDEQGRGWVPPGLLAGGDTDADVIHNPLGWEL